jgi:hypothetical protein
VDVAEGAKKNISKDSPAYAKKTIQPFEVNKSACVASGSGFLNQLICLFIKIELRSVLEIEKGG